MTLKQMLRRVLSPEQRKGLASARQVNYLMGEIDNLNRQIAAIEKQVVEEARLGLMSLCAADAELVAHGSDPDWDMMTVQVKGAFNDVDVADWMDLDQFQELFGSDNAMVLSQCQDALHTLAWGMRRCGGLTRPRFIKSEEVLMEEVEMACRASALRIPDCQMGQIDTDDPQYDTEVFREPTVYEGPTEVDEASKAVFTAEPSLPESSSLPLAA